MWIISDEIEKDFAVLPMASINVFKAFEPQRYICGCNAYIYDPATMGGLAFEELGKKWKCPKCGAKKKTFTKTSLRSIT